MKWIKEFVGWFGWINTTDEIIMKIKKTEKTVPISREAVEVLGEGFCADILRKCFILENGRYRVGNHWLHEGFNDNGTDIDSLCLMITRNFLSALKNGSTMAEDSDGQHLLHWYQLSKGDRDNHPSTGCLFIHAGSDCAGAVKVNSNVCLGDAQTTVDNFINQLRF